VVTSSIQNREKRQVIRNTWGKELSKANDQIRLIFLVGELPNTSHQNNIFGEQKRFGDILQGDFSDTYYNLTIKSLYMLKWFHHKCYKKVQYLMKVDDDMYVNIPQVQNLVVENTHLNMLTGAIIYGASPMTNGKYYAPPFMLTELQGSTYPNFLSGTAYVMSYTTAELLYRTSLIVPVFHLEDVYVTGFLPTAYNRLLRDNKLQHPLLSTFYRNKNISMHEQEIHPTHDCRFHQDKVRIEEALYANLISSHGLEPYEMSDIHKKVTKLQKSEYSR